jgi:CRP-like cAMP-binding protein
MTQSIIGNHSVRRCDKDTQLFQQGEPATGFFLVLDGWVKLYRLTP